MNQTSLILSMIIPGPSSPGNDIDVYLEPLIDELLELWKGVQTKYASTRKEFPLRAALLWTLNDFPALAYLYGWSTGGKYACHSCGASTKSFSLNKSKKMCYMGHRRWLPHDHKYRKEKTKFDGSRETELAPETMSGTSVLKLVEGREFVLGKKVCIAKSKGKNKQKNTKRQDGNHQQCKRKRGESTKKSKDGKKEKKPEDWVKKRSVFFKLPYWEKNKLGHNLDVMHIEKNVSENLIATLLNMYPKTKDALEYVS